MNFANVGLVLVGVGCVVAWGSSGIPPGGFALFPHLLSEFRAAKAKGQTPNDDAQMAHIQLRCYQIGGAMILGGGVLYFGSV